MSRLVSGIIANTVYGIEIKDMNHEYIKLVTQARTVVDTMKKPGKFWLDYMPLLRYVPTWVPGAAGVKYAARVRPSVEAMLNIPFDKIKVETVSDCSQISCAFVCMINFANLGSQGVYCSRYDQETRRRTQPGEKSYRRTMREGRERHGLLRYVLIALLHSYTAHAGFVAGSDTVSVQLLVPLPI